MKEITGRKFDVVIAGGGPAGASTAIRLASRGMAVLVVEQKHFPREKLCGEFISPECRRHFVELGVLDRMMSGGGVALDRTVFYTRRGRSVEVPSEWFGGGGHAIGLSRAEMDSILLERAREVGTTACEGVAAALWTDDGVTGLSIKSNSGESVDVTAKLTIDATGRSRALARVIEKANGSPKTRKPEFVAFKTHVRGAHVPERDCEIYAYPGGYGGSSLVENDRFNVCFIVKSEIAKRFGGDADRVLREHVFKNKRAADSLRDARADEPWLAVPISSYGRFNPTPANGLICVGDAAAFIDPFTGSGMLMALQCGEIAAEAILEKADSDFPTLAASYRHRHRELFGRRLQVCSLLRRAAFAPFFAESLITILSQSKSAARRLTLATRAPG